MEVLPNNSACLELTIAMPGFSSYPSSGGSGGVRTKEVGIINQAGTEEAAECMEEEDDESPAPRKKLRLTKQQSRLLEETFLRNHTLNPKEKEALAVELKLKARQVEVWFQNRRARSKMKQIEMECEYLKRWFGTLTEQNRRLQKEVDELRAIKMASYQPLPPSTLALCSRCESLINSTAATTAASSAAKVPFLRPRKP